MALDRDMVIPEYVALILDRNDHQARERGFPRTVRHKGGRVTVERTVELAAKMGARHLTIYGLSTENQKRSVEEVGALMQLFCYYMVRLSKIVPTGNMRVRMIGDRSRFDRDIIEGINRLESETRGDIGLAPVIVVSYGGRGEIRRVVTGLAGDYIPRKAEPDQVNEALFASYLDTAGTPDPDLLIRTSGELRLPNYLLWQLVYTEIAVTDCLWPDLDQGELGKTIVQYNKRER